MSGNGIQHEYEYDVGGSFGGVGIAEWLHAAGLDPRVDARPGRAEDWPQEQFET